MLACYLNNEHFKPGNEIVNIFEISINENNLRLKSMEK